MYQIRHAEDRGHTQISWLNSHHSFSFGSYRAPAHMGFRSLRVINDDRVAPGGGFGTHPHRDMEIISYVVEGALEHRDSMGNGSVIRPGDVQLMSAGTGVTHSEFNHSEAEPVRFLQIWLPPTRQGLEPRYDQKHFSPEQRRGTLRLLVSPEPDDEAVQIRRDVRIYGGLFDDGESDEIELEPGRHAWVQAVRGRARVNAEVELTEGDGLAVSDVTTLHLEGLEDAEILVFDLD